MNRRQLIFIILFNAIISLVIALVVVWAVESRRPDSEVLQILATPPSVLPVSQPTVAVVDAPAADTSATVTVQPATTAEAAVEVGDTEVYVVQSGDSLSSIADRFRVPIDTLVRLNELPNPDYVFVGQRLLIPVGGGNEAGAPVATATAGDEPITQGVIIRIVEGPGDLLAEAVQIVNDLNRAVNLAGWVLDQEGGPSYTFGNMLLFAGNYVWLHTRSGEDTTIAVYWNQENAAWSSGSVLRLRNPQGTVVSTFTVP
ncbi:MAG: LysM peptidoglycan-binding domain-containing protein [Caldilineaceae bacterium]|nr:LysM peptidoglycan-binding domain-containing protein [Caldilineaceae bacterium]